MDELEPVKEARRWWKLLSSKEGTEATNKLTQNINDLASAFKRLNDEFDKANKYFKKMESSGRQVEYLTNVLVMLTIILFGVGLYPILKDILPATPQLELAVISFGFAGIIGIFVKFLWAPQKSFKKPFIRTFFMGWKKVILAGVVLIFIGIVMGYTIVSIGGALGDIKNFEVAFFAAILGGFFYALIQKIIDKVVT